MTLELLKIRSVLTVHLAVQNVDPFNAKFTRFLDDRFDRNSGRPKVPVGIGRDAKFDLAGGAGCLRVGLGRSNHLRRDGESRGGKAEPAEKRAPGFGVRGRSATDQLLVGGFHASTPSSF